MLESEAKGMVERAATRPGRVFAEFLNKETMVAVNEALLVAAKLIDDMDLHDGYDEGTRDAAASRVRSLMIPEG